jgi:hypothetical protein
MLETGLKQWLNSKDEPGDFYQLVGLPRLCRDQARLLASLQEATEYLFPFQNHKDKRTRDRARAFQLQVAEARRIVSDRGRWDKYDRDVIDRLRALCRKNQSLLGPNAKLDDLRRWLALVQQVDPARVDELVQILRREPEEPPAAKRPAESETISSEALPTQILDTPKRGVELSDPAIPAKPAFVSTPKPAPPEEVGPKKEAPPPPPGRGAAPLVRGPASKAPPPPPKDSSKSGTVPTLVFATQPVPPAMHPLPHHAASNTTALWVVMGIVLGVLGLIVLGLTIAWATGAFEGRRSRAANQSDRVSIAVNVPETLRWDFITTTSSSGEEFC